MSEPKKTRINKYLSEIGYCSRRAADKLIEEKLGSLETRQFKPEFYSNNKNVTLQHNQNKNQRETLSD